MENDQVKIKMTREEMQVNRMNLLTAETSMEFHSLCSEILYNLGFSTFDDS